MQYDEKNQKTAETNGFGTARATWTLYDYDDKGNQTNVVSTLNRTNSFTYDDFGNLLTHTDPLGNVTSNLYDEAGNLTNNVVRGTNGLIVEQSFSIYEDGHLKETQNANHEVTARFYYDAFGNLTNTVDANNFSRKFTYDEDGNQTGSSYVWIDPNQNEHTITTTTGYDAAGRVTQTVDGNDNPSRTFYTAGGKVDYTIDKFGNTNSFLYDERGNMVQTTFPDGTVTRTVYNEDAKPYLTTDRNGVTSTRTDFDALGRATNVVRLTNVVINLQPVGNGMWSSGVGNDGVPISSNLTEYYDNGWVKSRTGPDGKTTSYDYWPDGQLMTVTDARTNVTYYEYDAGGRQRLVGDALNHTNRFEYDAVGRLLKTILANGTYTSNYFNGLGQRTVQVDQSELATQFGYNVSGQLTNVVKPPVPDPERNYTNYSPVWSYRYDDYGRLAVTTDPRNHSTTNTYDALGRLVAQQLPLGQTNWLRYNDKGQLSQQWDFKRQRTEYVYDRYGRVKAKFLFATDATYPSNAVCYLYNHLGQLTNIVERSGDGVTTNVCDGYAALVGRPDGGGDGSPRSRFARALAMVPGETLGSMLAIPLLAFLIALFPLDKRRLILESMREAWLIGVVQLSPTRAEATGRHRRGRLHLPSLAWRYATVVTIVALVGSDPAYDRLWTAQAECVIPSNSSTETERQTYFGYDFEGRLKQVNCPEGVINYGYDLATGRHISTCTTNAEYQYTYDELGRLETVVVLKRNGVSTNETTRYTYTKVGSRETVTLPNGVVTRYHYDDLNRLTNMTHVAGTTNLASYTYQLHRTGRRTNAVEVLRQENDTYLTNTITWTYDSLYRLTGEALLCSDPQYSYTNTYEYDLAGNRFKKIRVVATGTTTITNAYDANDRLLREVTLVSGACTETNAYVYDDNGSLTEKQEIRSSGTTTTTYAYNLANKLSSVTGTGGTTRFEYNDQGIRIRSVATSSTYYLIDANNHTGYAQVLEQMSTLRGATTMSYVLGDDALAQASGSSASYLLYDGHGSTRQLVNSTLGVTSKYNYDAYGQTLATSSSPAETSLLYCGEQFDPALQMYNLRARYYDPSNGRFNQRDTFEGDSFDPQSLHKYAYAHCDPVNTTDPRGEFTMIESIFVIALLLAAIVLSNPSDTPRNNIRALSPVQQQALDNILDALASYQNTFLRQLGAKLASREYRIDAELALENDSTKENTQAYVEPRKYPNRIFLSPLLFNKEGQPYGANTTAPNGKVFSLTLADFLIHENLHLESGSVPFYDDGVHTMIDAYLDNVHKLMWRESPTHPLP
jgi:RHS repeat-associated protein